MRQGADGYRVMSEDKPYVADGTDAIREWGDRPESVLAQFLKQDRLANPQAPYVHQAWPEKDPKLVKFLEAYEETGNIALSCRLSLCDRKVVYRKAAKSQAFADLLEMAKKISVENLEIEAQRRAQIGNVEPVYQKGELAGYIRKYSDALMVLLLKALAPEKYTERQKIETTGQATQVTFITAEPGAPPEPADEDEPEVINA